MNLVQRLQVKHAAALTGVYVVDRDLAVQALLLFVGLLATALNVELGIA